MDTCILTSLQTLRDPNARLDEGNVDGSAGLFLFVFVALCLNIGGSFLNCVLSTDSTVNLMNNQVDNNNNTVIIIVIRCVNNDYTDFQRMSPRSLATSRSVQPCPTPPGHYRRWLDAPSCRHRLRPLGGGMSTHGTPWRSRD